MGSRPVGQVATGVGGVWGGVAAAGRGCLWGVCGQASLLRKKCVLFKCVCGPNSSVCV